MHGLLIDGRDSQTPASYRHAMVCMLLCITCSGLLQQRSTLPLVYNGRNIVQDPFVHKESTCARITQKTNMVKVLYI